MDPFVIMDWMGTQVDEMEDTSVLFFESNKNVQRQLQI